MAKIRLNINGMEVTGYAGQTILEVARENGIEIPTLCYDERVAIYGACGLCVVEMEGNPKLMRACATTISEGMVINTNTKRVKDSRKAALELLLSDHTGDCRPPCALACPAGTDCQGYVGLVANGQYKEGVKLIKEVFPLPSSIGRVCPHPCETACRRQMVEEPISIAFIKSFLGDKDLESGHPYMPEVEPETGKTVAIIGGGPAGLTAAYQLRRKGHQVTIFDAMDKMGGMLRYGIPEYRLPKAILQKEIDLIAGMGVKMVNNVKIGKDLTFAHLRESYDAVLVAVGAWTSMQMGVKGEDNKNVLGGIDFLRKVAQGEPVQIGEEVAIVGGGNTAMDACRTAVRLGAKKVYCVYRRTRAEMPAEDIEIKEAEEEGVIFHYLTNPMDIVANEDGSLSHIVLQKMQLGEPDASGRRSPVPIEGATETLPVSAVIMALGQKLNPEGLEGIELTRKGTIAADEATFRTNLENVFAVGDATNKGAGIAIAAIGEGDKAARVMDSYLKGAIIPYKKPFVVERTDLTEADFADRKKVARQQMRHYTPEQRKDNFHEVNKGFTEEEAVAEAKRCLECGCHDYYECKLIHEARNMDVHPEKFDGASHNRTVDNTHPFIDRNPDKCILCGLCVRVCDEVMGRGALGLVGRGFDSMVKPALDLPLKATDCISCGQCVALCPTGALGEKHQNQKRVPVSSTCAPSVCAFCSVGCQTNVETKGNLVVKTTPAEHGLLCVNGRFGFESLQKAGRLTTPLVRKDGKLTPVSFEEASLYIAKKMESTAVRGGKTAVSLSDKLTMEELYIGQKLAKDVMGADVFSFAQSESGVKAVLGVDGSTAKLDELLSTNLIVLLETDLMKDHAVLGVKVRQAKARGAKVVAVTGNTQSDEWLTWADIAVDRADTAAFLKEVLKAQLSLGAKADDEVTAWLSDVTVSDEAAAVAKAYQEAKKAIIVFDQAKVGEDVAAAAADMAVLAGKVDQPRNGIIQIKRNANSQGLSDLDIAPANMDGVKALFMIGEDVPELDTKGLEFLAVADLYLTETARKADAVLPLISLTESCGTVVRCDGTAQEVKTAVPALGKDNLSVLYGVANAMRSRLEEKTADQVKTEMAQKGLFAAKALAPKAVSFAGKESAGKNTNAAFVEFQNFLQREGIR